jgi:tRNA-specific 2-thiouridylase
MPFYVFNFTDAFRDTVIRNFIESYENGITPNPCIDCNRYMKFDKLYERAKILGCDYIVTGHYARIEEQDGRFVLKKALDETKDQSYVLYSMTQEQLAHTVFPLGNMRKTQVRKHAEENGFINADKPDSQDICFVPNGDYASVIELQTGKRPAEGNFVDQQGNILGRHKGVIHYTIGQRKGLGISSANPLYVCKICPQSGDVVLGSNDDLLSPEADVADFNWISGEVPQGELRCKAKIRYRQTEQWATVIPTGEDTVHIIFDESQRAITPGQAAVLYDGDTVLGGGTVLYEGLSVK